MTKTLIVPGLDGSPAPHWQHWWALSDPHAITVDLSYPEQPKLQLWETELAGMVLRHPDSILVGHSLGTVLIARLLANWPHLRVRGALLVAPAETSCNPRIAHFGPIPQVRFDIPATVVASRNDPWMSFSRARNLSEAWGAELVDLGFAGHINVAAGYGPWPAAKQLRDDLLRRSAPAALRDSAPWRLFRKDSVRIPLG